MRRWEVRRFSGSGPEELLGSFLGPDDIDEAYEIASADPAYFAKTDDFGICVLEPAAVTLWQAILDSDL